MRDSHDHARNFVEANAKSEDVFIECFYDDDSDASAFVYRDSDAFYFVAHHLELDNKTLMTIIHQRCSSRSTALMRLALFVADEYDEALDMRALASLYATERV